LNVRFLRSRGHGLGLNWTERSIIGKKKKSQNLKTLLDFLLFDISTYGTFNHKNIFDFFHDDFCWNFVHDIFEIKFSNLFE
jgi:hypothetical protein